jgi:pilus assembly protein Flp/PilA
MHAISAYTTALFFALEKKFQDKAKGATAVEYGLLVGLIAVVIIGAITLLGGKISGLFKTVASVLPSGTASA